MTVSACAQHVQMKSSIGTKSVPKKSMTEPMAAAYDPIQVEKDWYKWWVSEGFFTPDAAAAEKAKAHNKFVMCLPPPNVTGHLHIGHALTMSIEDCMVRWHRMRGDATLWLPGTDHAGIATQSVVEKLLYKTEGVTRHDLGRDAFLGRVWEWKEDKGSHICQQATRLASSMDWSREFFTMDSNLSVAVTEAFCRFSEQGKMFRDVRLVNWSSHLRTALSDLEVDHEEVTKRTLLPIPGTTEKVEVGVIVTFKYLVKNSDPAEYVSVATTRLETMLGDVAVAVHPEDPRYTHLHGKQLVHPFHADRTLLVVADTYVDREFGTGCVKITPAHDPNDFALGKRHNLPMPNILTDAGTLNAENGAEFAGLHRFVARRKVEERLKELGLFVEKKDNPMKVPKCSRSGDIIEPVLRPQWWLDCTALAAEGKRVVANGEMKIHPQGMHEGTWNHWLDNVKDWCVSRQLWWGHRIPAYKVVAATGEQSGEDGPWYVARTRAEAAAKAAASLGRPVAESEMEQDSDVLDTWFSSGLLPMSGLGWPNMDAQDMKAFFPSTMLETGWDILFFWVARMVMMSIGLTGQVPFANVYLHALIRDAHGRKMSKSLGNVIDPLEVIEGITLEAMKKNLLSGNLPEAEVKKASKALEEDYPQGIPECGADALRFALLAYTLQPRAVNLDVKRIVGYRHFCNKLWNAVKFGLSYFEGFEVQGIHAALANLELEDEWILSKLSQCAGKVNAAMEAHNYAEATNAIFAWWLYDFCDVYLELVKPRMREDAGRTATVAKEVLYICLDRGLRLLHPMMPFVTEELYQRLPTSPSKAASICIATYPDMVVGWTSARVDERMETVKSIIGAFRSQMAQIGLKNSARPKAVVALVNDDDVRLMKRAAHLVVTLAKLESLEVVSASAPITNPKLIVSVLSDKCSTYIDAADLVDFAVEIQKLEKKAALAQKSLEGIEKKKAIPGYTDKVPAEVQLETNEKEEALRNQVKEINSAIVMLKVAGGL